MLNRVSKIIVLYPWNYHGQHISGVCIKGSFGCGRSERWHFPPDGESWEKSELENSHLSLLVSFTVAE